MIDENGDQLESVRLGCLGRRPSFYIDWVFLAGFNALDSCLLSELA